MSATESRTRAGLSARPGASTVPAIVALLVIVAAAWVVSIARMAGMDAGPGANPGSLAAIVPRRTH